MDNGLIQGASFLISTLTILSCLFLKVPQIMSIRKKKSGQGIYIQAILMEIFSYTVVLLYNFTNSYSVMTYLEYPIIMLQIYVMLYYVLKFEKMLNKSSIPLSVIIYIFLAGGFATEMLPKYIIGYFLPFCTPINGFAKITYIYGIVKAANADNVSLTTWVISVVTNMGRFFTIYVDSSDIRLLLNLGISATLSMGVLLTAMFYQRKSLFSPKSERKYSETEKMIKNE